MLNDLKGADNTLDGIHRTGRMIFKKAVELDVIKMDPIVFTELDKHLATQNEVKMRYRKTYQDDTTKHVYLHITKSKKKEASHKFGELMRNLNVK